MLLDQEGGVVRDRGCKLHEVRQVAKSTNVITTETAVRPSVRPCGRLYVRSKNNSLGDFVNDWGTIVDRPIFLE